MRKEKKDKLSEFIKNLPKASNIQDIKPVDPYPTTGGFIVYKNCDCGNYAPISTKGIIDYTCKNCRGKKRQIVFR